MWSRVWMEGWGGPGRTAARYSRMVKLSLRQLAAMERMAATLGPACSLPRCTQFLWPIAMGAHGVVGPVVAQLHL